jgi:hypothetical protein
MAAVNQKTTCIYSVYRLVVHLKFILDWKKWESRACLIGIKLGSIKGFLHLLKKKVQLKSDAAHIDNNVEALKRQLCEQ